MKTELTLKPKAKIAYKKAYEEGDADKILGVQQKMIQAEFARNQVGQIKRLPIRWPTNRIQLAPPPNNKAVEWQVKFMVQQRYGYDQRGLYHTR